MPASLNNPGQPSNSGSLRRPRHGRAVVATAVLFACVTLLLGLGLRPGPANALTERSAAAAPHFQNLATPTLQPGTGAVAGQAWTDADADGQFETGEQPLPGMTVTAKNSTTGATVSTTSGADGAYRLAGLAPGIYQIDATPPPSYVMTSQTTYSVVISAGAIIELNFGAYVPPTPTPSPTPPPLLDVENAEPLMCGGVYAGNTETGKNSVNTYSCRPWWDESGKERVYRLELTARQPVTVTLLNSSADLDLFLLRYALPDSCLAFGDNYLAYSADVGPYFLSVDGYRGASSSYTFRVECAAEVQATFTPTFTPSPTPTSTPTGTPAPTLTPTPTQPTLHAYIPLVIAPSSGPTPLPVTFVLQDGLNGYTGTSDSTLNSWFPTSAFGADTELSIFHARSSPVTSQMEPVLRFDLSLLPQNAKVDRAVLRLYAPATPKYDIRARVAGLLRPWDEQAATWELASPTERWASPGASGTGTDRTEWVSETQRIAEGSRWYEFDLTTLVRQWSAIPDSNYGLIVLAAAGDSNANVEARFVSREGTASWRPQLVISYSLAAGAGEQP